MKKLYLIIVFFTAGIVPIFAQRIISGKVSDSNGESLIGVNVLTKEAPIVSTITDIDGRFKLSVYPSNKKLLVSHSSFKSADLSIPRRTNKMDIQLKSSSALLSEVVLIGYGSSNKRLITDKVTSLSSYDISNIPVSNFQSTMNGKAAGVRINQNNGKVDCGINIRIRGSSSLNAGNEPLYVLDGMPLINENESKNGAGMNPLLWLSPSEIESINILKDASSAGIYGARGANGVLLITTKRGKVGKSNISFNISSGLSSPTHLVQFLNAKQYVDLFTEAAINTLGEINGRKNAESTFNYLAGDTDWRKDEVDTDWNKVAFRDGAQSDMDLSFSGGNTKTQYFLSGAINKTKGILLGNDLSRMSARINLNHQINNKISAGMNLGFSKTNIDRVDSDNSYASPLQSIKQAPISPAYSTDGTPNPKTLYPNFLLEDKYANYTTNLRRLTGKLFGEYKFLSNVKFNSDLGYDMSNQTEDQYRGLLTPYMSTNGFAFNSNVLSENYIWSNYITFEKYFSQNTSLNVIVGQEFNNSNLKYTNETGIEFPSDDFHNIASAAVVTVGKGSNNTYNFLSYFSRATFNLLGKYVLKGSIRRDGSSRFGFNKRYGLFPSISAGWIVSEEPFLKSNSIVSFLKIRGGYGQLGNSEIGNFASRTLYTAASYNNVSGIQLSQPGNNELTWEKCNQKGIGVEMGLFNDKVFAEIDVYSKQTNSLLFSLPLPGSSGQQSLNRNIGSIENRGLELTLYTKNYKTKSFQWNSSINLASNNNKVTTLPNDNAEIINGENIIRVDQPPYSFYLQQFAGVDPANGDALYYKNGEGTTTTSDYSEAKRVIVGNPQPTWISGLTNEINYKGLAFSFTFIGEWGASIFNRGGVYQSSSADYFDNQTSDQLNRWTKVGDVTMVPQARLYGQNGVAQSTRYLQKADFIRLRNTMFSYNLPTSILGKLKLSNVRIFLSGVNLLTFTDYQGYDPESRNDSFGGSTGFNLGNDFYSAPQAKSTSLGLNINF